MTQAKPNLEESFASWLAACDEMLAHGLRPSTLEEAALEPSLKNRVQRGVACLERLQTLWPSVESSAGVSPRASHESQPIITRLGKFELRREVGRGGFGVVYLAYDTELGRDVALKIPRLDVLLAPELRSRFEHEAQAAARLDHPFIVPVYEAGSVGIVSYIASAYCPGVTLAQWLREQSTPMPFADVARLVADLADAIQHAHSRGVLHRDLKPANVLLVSGGRVSGRLVPGGPVAEVTHQAPGTRHQTPRITDFGLAQLLPEAGKDAPATPPSPPSQGGEGGVAGTASYMSPEQADGRTSEIGTATDVYGLGAILYELLTFRPPFRAEGEPAAAGGMLATLDHVRTQEPIPPRRLRPEVPFDLQTICLKCLRKAPARRYASAAELAEDLRRYLRGEPIQARPVGVVERLWKWARRHPAWTAFLLIAIGTLSAGAAYRNHQHNEAVRQRQQIRAALRELVAGAELLLTPRDGLDLRPGLPPGGPFEQMQQIYEQLSAAPESIRDPALRHELARALRLTGQIHQQLKDPARARLAFTQAVALFDSLVAELPERRTYRIDLATTLCQQAEVLEAVVERDAALERAGLLFAELDAAHPDQPAFQREQARIARKRADLSGR